MSTLAHTLYGPQLLGQPGPTPAGTPAPQPEQIDEITNQIIATHTAMDTRILDGEQRKLIQNPNTADACIVARAQVQAMRAEPVAAQAAGFDGAQVTDLYKKHDCLRQGLHFTTQGLEQVDAAVAAEQAHRADGRQRVRRHIEGRLAVLPADDPERVQLAAARSHIDAAEERARQAQQGPKARSGKARADVLSQLRGAEADLQLGEVIHQLRTGQAPDYDTLLAAALHLASREAAEATEARRAPRA